MGILHILIACFLSSALAAQAGETLFVDRQDPSNARVVRDQMLGMIRTKQSRLVFLGEDHREEEVKLIYASVIAELARDPRQRVCYFHELTEAMDGALRGLGALNRSVDASRGCFELAHSERSETFQQIYGRRPNHWLSLGSLAGLARSGVRLAAIDWTPTGDDYRRLHGIMSRMNSSDDRVARVAQSEFEEILVVGRNRTMSERIRARFASEGCTVAFISVGAAHILPRNPEIRPLQALLSDFPGQLVVNGRLCQGMMMGCAPEAGADLNLFLR